MIFEFILKAAWNAAWFQWLSNSKYILTTKKILEALAKEDMGAVSNVNTSRKAVIHACFHVLQDLHRIAACHVLEQCTEWHHGRKDLGDQSNGRESTSVTKVKRCRKMEANHVILRQQPPSYIT